jgi:hypothetical protein
VAKLVSTSPTDVICPTATFTMAVASSSTRERRASGGRTATTGLRTTRP